MGLSVVADRPQAPSSRKESDISPTHEDPDCNSMTVLIERDLLKPLDASDDLTRAIPPKKHSTVANAVQLSSIEVQPVE